MKIYLASGFFTPETRERVNEIADSLRLDGYNVYVPMEHTIPNAWDLSQEDWAMKVFKMDLKALNKCDKVIYLDFGANGDCGAAWECGYAYAKGIPYEIICFAEDISIMLVCGCQKYEHTSRTKMKFV